MACAWDASLTAQVTAIGELLVARHQTLAVAESCTGGLLAAALTAVPGSSRWFGYGLVTYSADAKRQLLRLSDDLVSPARIVSESTALAMAAAVRALAGAAIAVGVTGIAGPEGGRPDLPVGTVCVGWVAGQSRAQTYVFPGNRDDVRLAAVAAALGGVQEILAVRAG
ncbi:MAG: CinA family protein [Gammaproteobacteria bacterium]|nr:CinA family protein [Gammaproteobacteria bacterium]